MSLSPIVSVQVFISLTSIFANLLGIYCLSKSRLTDLNQRLLQQNLSTVEVVKTILDFLPLTLFTLHKEVYDKYHVHLAILETNMMSVLYFSYVLLITDRLMYYLCNKQYTSTSNPQHTVKKLVLASWLVGLLPGLFFWAVFPGCLSGQMYYKMYYIAFDFFIVALALNTYAVAVVKSPNLRQRFVGWLSRTGTPCILDPA